MEGENHGPDLYKVVWKYRDDDDDLSLKIIQEQLASDDGFLKGLQLTLASKKRNYLNTSIRGFELEIIILLEEQPFFNDQETEVQSLSV